MTSNGLISNNNHAVRSVRRNIGLESAGFAAAEGASMVTSLGVVAVMDKVVPKPLMDKATDIVSKVFIEPYLDTIERNLAKCRLEECQVDETKTREERARRLANGVVIFGTAYCFALAAKFGARKYANKLTGVTEAEASTEAGLLSKVKSHIPFVGYTRDANMITIADEAVHIGSLIYLNTKASQFTDDHIKSLSKTLEKFGVSKEKAKEVSTMVMVWEVPNFLGMMAGGTAIAGKHAKGWGMDKKHPKYSIMDVVNGTAKAPSIS